MLLRAGSSVRGGGAGPQADGAPHCGREEEPPAEGASSKGETLAQERTQGHAEGRTGDAGAAGQAAGRRTTSRSSPQRDRPGAVASQALWRHSRTPKNAALRDPPGLESRRGEPEAAGRPDRLTQEHTQQLSGMNDYTHNHLRY